MGKTIEKYSNELRELIDDLRDMESLANRLRNQNEYLLRLMAYMNIIVALINLQRGHYILAGFNLVILVTCLEFVLFTYRKREKRARDQVEKALAYYEETAETLDFINNQIENMNEEFEYRKEEFKTLMYESSKTDKIN